MAEAINRGSLPRGNSRDIALILTRHADLEIPEQKLMLAVLLKAISDLMDKTPSNKYHRAMAREFFTGSAFVFFCDMCGLNPEWVMDILRKHAGLEAL
ncbi:MAG: hypothetical protein HRU77_04260 [Gammaproteobacteria bacterium]|nr:MAG: hypothetical protein HRU77_04260 [Gammaproteobacteria bacterium]